MTRKTVPILAVLAVVVMAAGCAHLPDKSLYHQARVFFNDTVERYLDVYDAQSADVQTEWKAQIDPWVAKTEKILDEWGQIVAAGGDASLQRVAYENAKDELIDLLFVIYKEVSDE